MSKTLKNTISAVAFIGILASILMGLSFLMKPGKSENVNALEDPLTNGILSEEKNTVDVLFLGDSECYSTFIPLQIWKEHGITSYVCGTSDQVLSYSYELLAKSMKKQDPKVVVLETNAIFREVTSTKAFLNKAEGLFSVFKYHDRWKLLQPKELRLNDVKTYDRRSKGYLFNASVSPADTDGYMEPCGDREPVPKDNLKYLTKIRDYCKKNGAELVLVSVPSTKNWNYSKHNAVSDLASELEINYVDMNTLGSEIPIDWKRDTRDKGDHLNYFGASKATEYFGKYLESKGFFEDKRKLEKYSYWNRTADEFLSSVEKV